MYNTTGFTRDEVIELCAMINAAELEPGTKLWPPILGLFRSAVVALTYMRRNRVQAEIAESFGVSQPTVSRGNQSGPLSNCGVSVVASGL